MKKKNETMGETQTEKKRSSLGATVGKYLTAAVVLLVLFWFGFTCTVREGSCAVIMRFGAVRTQTTQAGVYLKLPWPFETVVTYDNRIQTLESDKLETTTADKRNIMIQSSIAWQIRDVVKFHNSVGVQGTGETFIKGAVDNSTNKVLGTYELSQMASLATESLKIEQIQQESYENVRQVCLDNYGNQVSDVSFKMISLPETNLNSVFQQMTADRQKEIDKILADARLEATKLTTDAAALSSETIANGVKEAAEINAQTEKEVAQIYAEAQAANLELYQFLMNMDTLAASVDETTVLVVRADEYPFNILTQYSQTMTAEGDTTLINDLTYILEQLPEADRQALIEAIYDLIDQAA